jgi:hypothetical protein
LKQKHKNILRYLLLTLSVIFLGLNFVPVMINWKGEELGHAGEKYDPTLAARIQTIDDLLQVTDERAAEQHVNQGSVAYTLIMFNLVEENFRHGYSYYKLSENWIAALSGAIKSDYAAKVLPNAILKNPNAACSQQSIVLMNGLRRKGFDVRKVIFPTHFALEARVNGKWYFYDPDVEPYITLANISDVATIASSENLNGIYDGVLDRKVLHENFDSYQVGEVNESIAPNAMLFHRVTFWLSKGAFIFPLLLLPFVRRRKVGNLSATPIVSMRNSADKKAILP